MHLLHFLSPVYYHAEEIASVSYSLIKKWKSISPFSSPLLIFFLHFFHAKERVMNELCLCEVAEIHLVVSNMDFHAGRSLMSLHLFSFCFFVFFYACSCIIMCVKVFFIMFGVYVSRFLCVCVFQVHVMCGQFVGLPVEYTGPHLQRHGRHGGPPHHQAPSG